MKQNKSAAFYRFFFLFYAPKTKQKQKNRNLVEYSQQKNVDPKRENVYGTVCVHRKLEKKSLRKGDVLCMHK